MDAAAAAVPTCRFFKIGQSHINTVYVCLQTLSTGFIDYNSEELLSMLMLLYTDDLVLLAPSRSDLKTALKELERITREWGMVCVGGG